ncbi:hypothetical protein CHT98_18140 (plasmid) [Azospirillum brasilense]|uniref:Uncharacterized protein n=2 Tax=Azospirillum brasilense TaxID=192 RepID=A0A235HB86_AZOBR|nr:hypothetical protein CHT98_18140 [Azospirillum brasilense]
MVGSRGRTVAGAPITIEKYYGSASAAMKILRCEQDPGLLGTVTCTAAAMHRAHGCLPERMALGEAVRMGTTGALMLMTALTFLVAVVSYDPTPLRVIVTALCCALAGFLMGRR